MSPTSGVSSRGAAGFDAPDDRHQIARRVRVRGDQAANELLATVGRPARVDERDRLIPEPQDRAPGNYEREPRRHEDRRGRVHLRLEQVLGVLEVVNKTTGEPFTREDLDLLLRLVDQTAIAIERTSLYQKMAELAITDDLTKLFNTRYLNRTIEMEIQRSSRYPARRLSSSRW